MTDRFDDGWFEDENIPTVLAWLFPEGGADEPEAPDGYTWPAGPGGRRKLMARFVAWIFPVIAARVNQKLGVKTRHRAEDYCMDAWERLVKDNAGRMKAYDTKRGKGFKGYIGMVVTGIVLNLLARDGSKGRGGGWTRGDLDDLDNDGPGHGGDAEDGHMARMAIGDIIECTRGKLSPREFLIYAMLNLPPGIGGWSHLIAESRPDDPDEPDDRRGGFTHAEVARILGVSMNAVYKANSNGKKALDECRREHLGEEPDDSA